MAEGSSSGNSSSSKSLMWMMIGLFTGIGVLLAGGLFVASRVVRSMGLSAASAKDTVRTPGGSFRMEKETQVGPGLPVYPRSSLIVPDDEAAMAAECMKTEIGCGAVRIDMGEAACDLPGPAGRAFDGRFGRGLYMVVERLESLPRDRGLECVVDDRARHRDGNGLCRAFTHVEAEAIA